MRNSRKRKLGADKKVINVIVNEETRSKLDRMAGPESLGWMVEELINREWRRREKRLTQQVQDSSLTQQQPMP